MTVVGPTLASVPLLTTRNRSPSFETSMVQGRQAIEEYWRNAIESGAIRDVSVETMDARSSGSLGYETGSFVLTVNGPDGKPMVDRGRYVELLRRESDGTWRSTHGIWNASPE